MIIQTIEDVVRAVQTDLSALTGNGRIRAQEIGDLVLLNYTPQATVAGVWTPVECLCRGLIINRVTGEIVARPFDKFFNWGQGGRTTEAPIVRILEKLDGSLGIFFRTPAGPSVATRGSMTSWQAEWATTFLRTRRDVREVDLAYTLLFEIICPENRIVVDYGGREDLVLLAARNRLTGAYADHAEVTDLAQRCGFAVPREYRPTSVEDLVAQLAQLSANEEGFVAEFADGQRFKFKGAQYLAIARVVQHLSFKHTVETMALGTEQDIRAVVPRALLGSFEGWVGEINEALLKARAAVEATWAAAPKGDRKAFAQYVLRADPTLAPCLFQRWDGKDWTAMMWRVMFGYRGTVSKKD